MSFTSDRVGGVLYRGFQHGGPRQPKPRKEFFDFGVGTCHLALTFERDQARSSCVLETLANLSAIAQTQGVELSRLLNNGSKQIPTAGETVG